MLLKLGVVLKETSNILEGFTLVDSVRKRPVNSLRNRGCVCVCACVRVRVRVRNTLLIDGFVAQNCHACVDCVVLYYIASVFHGMTDKVIYVTYVSPEGSPIYSNIDDTNGVSILGSNIEAIKTYYPE